MNRKQRRAEAKQGARVTQRAAPDVREMFAAALQNQRAGRLGEAERLCRRVLTVDSRHADSLLLLGAIACQAGRHDLAVDMLGKAIAIDVEVAAYHGNLGVALQKLGRLEQAVGCYRKAIELRPDFAEAHSNLGNALALLGRLDEAAACCRSAIELRPGYPEAHGNLGVALQKLGRLEQAVGCYRKAVELGPNDPGAYRNLGGALQKLGRLDEAVGCLRKAIELRPDDAEAQGYLGGALAEQGRLAEALARYDKAIALKPGLDFLQGRKLHTRMCMCDWDGIKSQTEDLIRHIERGEKISPPFISLSLIDCSQIHRKSAEIFVRSTSQATDAPPAIARHPRRDKIRLGYFSADYHAHATSRLMAGLFEQHDRASFEIVGFSFGPDKKDAMRERVAASFDRFIDVRDRSDRDVALLARKLEIDIAVDLKGFTTDSRWNIFAHRAAPLQVNYLGYPGTMGADYMDYIIADRVLIPDDSGKYYSENIIYLPHSYQANDRKRPIAERLFTRQELRLPDSGFVYCCFNNNYKITPAIFDGWMRILGQVRDSVLWLLADNPWAERNLRREAAARGVAAERLVFAGRLPAAEHLARQRAADLFLDTLPYNAHTTASDALWAGLPVLTRAGTSFPSRVAASLLTAIDLPELITTTPEDYERRAIELARNPEQLSAIRARLARNRLTTPLFDTGLFARHIETAYVQMYERYQAGLAPAPIHVAPL